MSNEFEFVIVLGLFGAFRWCGGGVVPFPSIELLIRNLFIHKISIVKEATQSSMGEAGTLDLLRVHYFS